MHNMPLLPVLGFLLKKVVLGHMDTQVPSKTSSTILVFFSKSTLIVIATTLLGHQWSINLIFVHFDNVDLSSRQFDTLRSSLSPRHLAHIPGSICPSAFINFLWFSEFTPPSAKFNPHLHPSISDLHSISKDCLVYTLGACRPPSLFHTASV